MTRGSHQLQFGAYWMHSLQNVYGPLNGDADTSDLVVKLQRLADPLPSRCANWSEGVPSTALCLAANKQKRDIAISAAAQEPPAGRWIGIMASAACSLLPSSAARRANQAGWPRR